MFEYLRPGLRALFWGLVTLSSPAWAQLTLPGADGSDGAFAPTEDVVIDLSLAPTASWDSRGSGNGVYDPEKWAVVFKYSAVDIPEGVDVTFKNHGSRAPVVWLVSGDANIAGLVNLQGQNWVHHPHYAEPGPGGFPGGIGLVGGQHIASGGFGIGGGGAGHRGGNHATTGARNSGVPTYGNRRILPLIGGSGGGGDENQNFGGGAGGGALLLAVAGTLTVDGIVAANGGHARNYGAYGNHEFSGAGAGGAIRLIADTIAGSGLIYARGRPQRGGSSGWGRIRLEALHAQASWDLNPVTTVVAPDDPVLLWPPAGTPSVRVVSVAAGTVPADPHSRFEPGQEDVTIGLAEEQVIVLETTNVDPAATVRVRITPEYGGPFFVDAALDSGTADQATWIATADLPEGYFTVQAHAVNPAP